MNAVAERPPDLARRVRLAAEVVLIFYGLPLAYVVVWRVPFVFGLLWVGAAIAAWVLWHDPTFERAQLRRTHGLRFHLRGILLLFAVAAIGMTLAVWAFTPDQLFRLPLRKPWLWALIVVLYPLLSVYPQELIWRALFFHRYRPLFGGGGRMILASGLAFSWLHVVMLNPLAVWLTLPGGVLFGWRYWRSGSLVVTSIEHGLYGLLIFTVGLGTYFVQGTRALQP